MIDWHSLSPWLLLLAPLAVVLGYTVFGLSGFGSTIISVPILAHFLPVSYLVPLMAILDLVSSVFVGTTGRKHLSKRELLRLLPLMFVGFGIGATLLVTVPDAYLRAALGFFAVAIGANAILNPALHRSISVWWCVPAGLIGGAVSTLFGAGGPIYATYLSGRLHDKSEVRATTSTVISISAFSRAAVYIVSGLLLNLAVLAGLVFLAPFVWLGLRTGHRIHVNLSQQQMRRVVGGIVLVTGTSLLARVFFGL
ncbi:MAG TPA: sulfite exporter TauE/SafE family protein [Usitatibacter sp.]|jgi:hypothetical protein|nr:sulfite exporter TauE/SafE family protein [Usitatibacter sp.]